MLCIFCLRKSQYHPISKIHYLNTLFKVPATTYTSRNVGRKLKRVPPLALAAFNWPLRKSERCDAAPYPLSLLTSSLNFLMSSVSLWCVLMTSALPLATTEALSIRSGLKVPWARKTSSGFRFISPITSLAIYSQGERCARKRKKPRKYFSINKSPQNRILTRGFATLKNCNMLCRIKDIHTNTSQFKKIRKICLSLDFSTAFQTGLPTVDHRILSISVHRRLSA